MADLNKDIICLVGEYLCGEMDEERRGMLMEWVKEKKENKVFFESICAERTFRQRWELRGKIDTQAAIRKFDRHTSNTSGALRIRRWAAFTAVAAVVLIALVLSFLFVNDRQQSLPEITQSEILPGSSKAILVLSGGKQLELTGNDSIRVDLPMGTQVINKDRQLIYENATASVSEYNELRTPRGGEYRVALSDGSVVRLNSGSSLKYPVAFPNDKREVELTGEAYFEVTKSTTPFRVKVGAMTVKVYGTTFNINTHAPGCVRTALVEGKIGITVKGETKEFILTPSQLADFNIRTQVMNIRRTDITPYIAWTNGLFVFDNEPLGQIMNTLSLWYDVDVFYQNPALQNLHFTGCVKRYDQIGNILRALSQTVGVKFNQNGKTLTISY